MSRWPDFFIVGAPRAGTTSLCEYLRQHPEVFIPSIKEPNFFGSPQPRVPGQPYTVPPPMSERRYLRLFQGAEGFKAAGEATTSYLWDEKAPLRIKERLPGARIVVLLRDPVELAYSGYLYFGDQRMPFLDSLQAGRERLNLESGMYYQQVKRYLETFGSDQVLVLMFEEMKRDPRGLLDRLARFLGVSPERMTAVDTSQVFNRYLSPRGRLGQAVLKGSLRPVASPVARAVLPDSLRRRLAERWLLMDRRPPPLDPQSRECLQRLYAPDLERLEQLLGAPLPLLRASWR